MRPKAIDTETQYSQAEAAVALRCSTRTISRLVNTGDLTAHYAPGVGKVRRRMYFTDSDFAAYRKNAEAGPAANTAKTVAS